MIYYILLAFIDIGLFLKDNWKELTFTAIASGIGVILGKRLGIRIAVNYIMKTLGLEQKSTLEHQVAWLIEQEGKRGNIWSAPISKPLSQSIHLLRLKRGILSRMVQSIARYMGQHTNWRKRRMNKLKSRKFWFAILAVIVPVINEQFNINLDTTTVVAIIGGLVAYILGESHVDAKKQESNQYH